VKGGGREILVPAWLWGHDRSFLDNNVSEEGLEKKEEEYLEEEETWMKEELGNPKAPVEDGEVHSNAEEMRSKEEPTSSNASLGAEVHLGEKTSEIRLIIAFLTRNRRNFRLNCQFSTFHVTIRL
jgi:hypothetical protein